jgi:bifunctional ADP-heptose synthase (sugar kinase/adenylyltransferase)
VQMPDPDLFCHLSAERLEQLLGRLPGLAIGVLGDLFVDRYLDLDAALTEPSLETGLDAYQVVGVRSLPGAAGTIVNNLAALGVGRIVPLAIIGDDGEGFELRQALCTMPAVVEDGLLVSPARRTPTYVKPLLHQPDGSVRELNRLDIKNRLPLASQLEQQLLGRFEQLFAACQAWVVLDQVSEEDCGVVTRAVRERLAELAGSRPDRFVLADSRERIGAFRGVSLKPNRQECVAAVWGRDGNAAHWPEAARQLAARVGRAVFCTAAEQGILVAQPDGTARLAAAYPVDGPVDPVGAGDSTSAAIVCAVASGLDLAAAAAFGNLVASITVQQIGTTGTASPAQVRRRWAQVAASCPRPA